jgi:hypothetical protein
MVARLKKRKMKKLPRRIKTGIAGAPIDDGFRWYAHYFRTEVEKKELAGVIRNYIRQSFTKDEAKFLLSAPDWYFYAFQNIPAIISWKQLNLEFPENHNPERALTNYFESLRVAVNKRQMEEAVKIETPVVKSKSPMEILKQKTSDMLGYIDETIDAHFEQETNNANTAFNGIDIYSLFQKDNVAYNTAKHSFDHIKDIHKEIEELIETKDPDLVEAYSYMKLKRQKIFLQFLQDIKLSIEKYILNKKAGRKTKSPTIMTADKQIKRLKYNKESKEYKIVSIPPIQIIGATHLFVFNTKYRSLIEYVSDSPKGFGVKGTTLQNIDVDKSRSIRLRKPEEMLTIVQSKAIGKINKAWKELTTKESKPNPRINEHCILIRVMK